MVCSNCGTENRPGRKFCSQCGQALAAVCPVCGAANDPTDRFCGECGTDLGAGDVPRAPAASRPAATPLTTSFQGSATERRLVTVLFADLVGFTSLSENRDAEEVRDLLSRYFADVLLSSDRAEEALECDRQNLDLSTRQGDRVGQRMANLHIVFDYDWLRRWDDALSLVSLLGSPEESSDEDVWLPYLNATLAPILVRRGEVELAKRALEGLERLAETTEVQDQAFRHVVTGWVRLGEGRAEDALDAAAAAFGLRDGLGGLVAVVPAFALAVEAALELGRPDRVKEIVAIAESAPARDRTSAIRASIARFQGHVAAAEGNVDEAERRMAQAITLYREIKYPFWMAVAETERAELLQRAAGGEDAGTLLREAREIFERLKAVPWLERLAKVESGLLDRAAVAT
jgi:class 3 adenylate cyclase